MKRQEGRSRLQLQVRAASQQQPHDSGTAVKAGMYQRRPTVMVLAVHVGAVVYQDARVAFVIYGEASGVVQRRTPEPVDSIHARTQLQALSHLCVCVFVCVCLCVSVSVCVAYLISN